MLRFLITLVAAVAIWAVLFRALFGPSNLWQANFDIQLHNTYFVLGGYHLQVATLLLVILLALLGSMVAKKARHNKPTLLVLALGSALLVLHPGYSGYTVYPPLNGLSDTAPNPMADLQAGLLVLKALSLGVLCWTVVAFARLRKGTS